MCIRDRVLRAARPEGGTSVTEEKNDEEHGAGISNSREGNAKENSSGLYEEAKLNPGQELSLIHICTGAERQYLFEALKFSTIVITTLPITVIYPFFQKHFVQGVMIGAVKS